MNKTTILYGPRESGKSTLIEEIIYLCKDHIPVVFLVLGTNVDNSGAFSNRIPKTCIKNSLDKEWLE
jgi:predicted AAA+ superfamily ATPase